MTFSSRQLDHISKNLTYFEKICLVVACNQTGMSDGHAMQGPVGRPMPRGLHDSLAWIAVSSGQTKHTELKKTISGDEEYCSTVQSTIG